MPTSSRTLRVQDQAEQVFERRDYDRAFFIFRNELAPIGDKYAQYMVGFMYLTGKGVPESQIAASAWYRLAAERGTKEFISVSNELIVTFEPSEIDRSDRLFIQLRKQYGDLALLLAAIRKDRETLRARTGSRISAGGSPMTIIEPNRPGGTQSGAVFYDQIQRRMQARLDYVARHTHIEVLDTDAETADLDSIESVVYEQLDTLD